MTTTTEITTQSRILNAALVSGDETITMQSALELTARDGVVATYFDGTTVSYDNARAFAAAHRLDVDASDARAVSALCEIDGIEGL